MTKPYWVWLGYSRRRRKENILGIRIVWTFLYLINFRFPCSGLLNLGSCRILSNHYGVSSLAICTFCVFRKLCLLHYFDFFCRLSYSNIIYFPFTLTKRYPTSTNGMEFWHILWKYSLIGNIGIILDLFAAYGFYLGPIVSYPSHSNLEFIEVLFLLSMQ